MKSETDTRGHAGFWALFGVAFLLRAWGIPEQPALLDETLAADAAVQYLRTGHLGDVMWYHPPLRNYVLFLSRVLFGEYSAWGLRFGSILMGSLTVPALGYLGRDVFQDRRPGYLAALFLAVDPLHIALSRLAFQESTTPLFIVLGVLATVRAVRVGRAWSAYAAGICFGLASASKWHGLFPWAFCGTLYLAAPWVLAGKEAERRPLLRFVEAAAAYGAVPVAIYTASYLPWLHRGNDLGGFIDFQRWLVTRQYVHKATEDVFRTLSSRAWEWFVRPTAWTEFVISGGRPYLTVAMGNFLVWVLTLPSLIYGGYQWARERSLPLGFVIGLFLVSYAPLVFTHRGIFVFSAPAVIPFGFLLIARALSGVARQSRPGRMVVAGYLLAVTLLSAFMYPMAMMKTLEYGYLKPVADRFSPHGEGLQDPGDRGR